MDKGEKTNFSTRWLLSLLTDQFGANLDPARMARAVAVMLDAHKPFLHANGSIRCMDDRKKFPCPTVIPFLQAALPADHVRRHGYGSVEYDNAELVTPATWLGDKTLDDVTAILEELEYDVANGENYDN